MISRDCLFGKIDRHLLGFSIRRRGGGPCRRERAEFSARSTENGFRRSSNAKLSSASGRGDMLPEYRRARNGRVTNMNLGHWRDGQPWPDSFSG